MSTEGTEHQDTGETSEGAGPEGTIPESSDGIAAGSTEEASHFEPEEDGDEA